ncbi:hypothetical protein ABZP36_012550 [Zizania latifolia]
MAPSLLAAASPFLLHGAAGSGGRRTLAAAPGRRAASTLRVSALKYDPSKVAPQSDRVLVRLEQIPEKSVGGVLLPKSAVKFERYLMGEILSVGADVSEVEAGKKVNKVFLHFLTNLNYSCSGGLCIARKHNSMLAWFVVLYSLLNGKYQLTHCSLW